MTSLSTELMTGDGRILSVGEVAQYYRDIVNLSAPSQGRIQKLGEDVYSLTSQFKTVDCDTQETIRTQKVYSLTTKSGCIDVVRCVSDALGVSESVLVTSKNGRFTARLKEPATDKNSDGYKKQFLEIWDRSRLLKTIDTSELDVHGTINTGPVFGNIIWSTFGEQDKLLYVCQRKRQKNLSFFEKHVKKDEASSISNRGEEYIKHEDWGECLDGIDHTMVAVLDVANNCHITAIDIPDHTLCCPQWLDGDNKIVFQAYMEKPRRLGIIYCNNRPSKMMVFDWRSSSDGLYAELMSHTECFHTLVASNSGENFIFLSNPVFGAHCHSVKLNSYDIRTKRRTSLPVDLSGIDLFIESSVSFTDDDKHILFISSDHLSKHMYFYTLETNKVTEVKFPNAGFEVLDFRYNIILASGSDIDSTPTLFVATVNSKNIEDVVAWHQIEDCIHLEDIEYETYKIPLQDESSFISAILTKPNLKIIQANLNERTIQEHVKLITNDTDLPTIVSVHGGPHANFLTHYLPMVVFWSRLGLKVMMINYRGSTGVSEDYLQSLCGKIGQQDIGDCLEAIRYFTRNKLIDPSKLIIQGGSHGGFIACHLSCQNEFQFTSAIIRNPVVDLSTLYATSDIPDWGLAEAFAQTNYDPTWLPDERALIELRNISPMFNAAKAKVPTLMLLGNKDRRVTMFQGERWVDLLRAYGVEVQCKIYPDRHGFDKNEIKADWIISSDGRASQN